VKARMDALEGLSGTFDPGTPEKPGRAQRQ
jgi:hypothetical protein